MPNSLNNSQNLSFSIPKGSHVPRPQFKANTFKSWKSPSSAVNSLEADEQSTLLASPFRSSIPRPVIAPIEVVVTHFVSPDEFYVQHSKQLEDLKKMMVEVQRSASISNPPSRRVYAGQLFYARTSTNSLWYRVEVLTFLVNRYHEERVCFKFVDYGQSETVTGDWRKVFRLLTDRKIRETPYFAVKARLADVFSPNSDGSYPNADHIVTNQTFIMETVEDESVKLTYPDGGEDLASLLFRQGVVKLASDIVPPSLNRPSGFKPTSKLDQPNQFTSYVPHQPKINQKTLPISVCQAPKRNMVPAHMSFVVSNEIDSNLMETESVAVSRQITPQPEYEPMQILARHLVQASANVRVELRKEQVTQSRESEPQGDTDNEYNTTDQIIEERKNGKIDRSYVDVVSSRLKNGSQHPDLIIEDSLLAKVSLPEISHRLVLPKKTTKNGFLSKFQLETIIHICQQHELTLPDGSRVGFLLGDGPGVGKGRTLAGLILENFLRGYEKALWISDSDDAQEDIERDFRDIVAKQITVHTLKKMKLKTKSNEPFETGVLFSTYSCLKRKNGSRLKQLVEWLGNDFNGVVVFDKCHRAKESLICVESDKLTNIGLAILELQSMLPKARVVYSFSTGPSDPYSFAFMTRLGLWGPTTPFKESGEFVDTIQKYGPGAMEVVALEMKQRGVYISRKLSFKDVAFRIHVVPLSSSFVKVYNDSLKLWDHLLQSFKKATNDLKINKTKQMAMWTEFWSAHRRFFQLMSIAPKVMEAVQLAKEAVIGGKCAVISFQETEDCPLEQTEMKLLDFPSAKAILETLVVKHFPEFHRRSADGDEEIINLVSDEDEDENETGCKRKATCKNAGSKKKREKNSSDSSMASDLEEEENDLTFESDRGTNMKAPGKIALTRRQLLTSIEQLGANLPLCPIDQLIHELGGFKNVAEITKRKDRILKNVDNQAYYESRFKIKSQLKLINKKEKQSFMDGEKMFAIISEGVNREVLLQADRTEKNQRRRVYITLELPSTADKVVEQFGRIHRTNQVNSPELVILISDLISEKHFASVVSKRLLSLGGHPFNNRQCTVLKENVFEIDLMTCYGHAALEAVLEAAYGGLENLLVPLPVDYKGDFFKDIEGALVRVGLILAKTGNQRSYLYSGHRNVTEFLNSRMWGMTFDLQNRLFQYLVDTASVIFNNDKAFGSCDQGIVNLVSCQDDVQLKKLRKFIMPCQSGEIELSICSLTVDHGIDWFEAEKKLATSTEPTDGFYLTTEVENGKPTILLAQCDVDVRKGNKQSGNFYTISYPNSGLQSRKELLEEIKRKSHQVAADVAKPIWNDIYDFSKENCLHVYRYGDCREKTNGSNCQYGVRQHTYHVLSASGSLSSLWIKMESFLRTKLTKCKIQFVQIFSGDVKIVGILVPANMITEVIKFLKKESLKESF